jgi:hypothetical protein
VKKPELYVAVYDLHHPEYHRPTITALFDFLTHNKVSGFIFGGDQFNNDCISHHTKNKPLYRLRNAFKKDEDTFRAEILNPLEKLLPEGCEKVWIEGNHERFEDDLVEEQPELEGLVDRVHNLKLEEKGWQIVSLGRVFKHGHLSFLHGEWLTGIGNQAGAFPSKKLVEVMAGNAVAGHTHTAQSFTRISPVDQDEKWMGWIAPCACNVNPAYLRNRPTAWLNGFVIVEFMPGGNFNCYPIVVSKGQFAYGGRIYGEERKKLW